jgi:hypothetical protein
MAGKQRNEKRATNKNENVGEKQEMGGNRLKTMIKRSCHEIRTGRHSSKNSDKTERKKNTKISFTYLQRYY